MKETRSDGQVFINENPFYGNTHLFGRRDWLEAAALGPSQDNLGAWPRPFRLPYMGSACFPFMVLSLLFIIFLGEGGLVSDWPICVLVGRISCFAVKLEMPWNTLDFPDFLCLDIFPAAERAVYPILLYFNVF